MLLLLLSLLPQDAKEYKDIPDAETRAKVGKEIFQKYLAKDASEPINVNSHNMADVTQNMAKGEVRFHAFSLSFESIAFFDLKAPTICIIRVSYISKIHSILYAC